jgi:hypothetical protein
MYFGCLSLDKHTKHGDRGQRDFKVYTQYTGTDLGDDCQIKISEVE